MHSTICRCLFILLVGLGSCGAPRVSACGPDFPNAYLTNSIDELSALPALSFQRELERLVPNRIVRSETPEALLARNAAAERLEVREALARAGMSGAALEWTLAAYRRDAPPVQLPCEFQLYARGARAWHEDRVDEAVSAWAQLLQLPENQRHYRTVWAAYMIGRARCDTQPDLAIDACVQAQTAAAHGFADSQELAAASIGWQARAFLRKKGYASALGLYLAQFQNGEPTALGSIQWTLQRAFRGEDLATTDDNGNGCPEPEPFDETAVQEVAANPILRSVVTAWFAARGGPRFPWGRDSAELFARWIASLPKAGDLSPDEATRWCWAAYQNGRWKDARALADEAPADAPAAEWVRAMLLLREGFTKEAARHLANATRSFITDPALADVPKGENRFPAAGFEQQPLGNDAATQLGGTQGVLALHSEQYVEALRLFMQTHLWADAAYVAERVLTLDELKNVVDQEYRSRWYSPRPDATDEGQQLRHLLARRLVRAKRYDEAKWYFPASVAALYNEYVANVRKGWDYNNPPRDRGLALWAAAKLLHDHGMELEGTELEPDFGIWDGEYTGPDFGSIRGRSGNSADNGMVTPRWAMQRETVGIGVTRDELNRLDAIKVPTQRFHYRYHAAELGWQAAALLPNFEEETAEILNTAGLWLSARDPELAKPFYQSLVLRCANTPLGCTAAKQHWLVRKN